MTASKLVFVLEEAKVWEGILGAVEPVVASVAEAVFDAGPKGIRLRAMDPSHVGMVDLEWLPAAFKQYSFEGDPFLIGLMLTKVLKKAQAKDELRFTATPEEVEMRYAGQKFTRTFTLRTLDVSATIAVPEVKASFTTTLRLASAALTTALEDIEAMGGNSCLILDAAPEKVRIAAVDEDAKITYEMPLDKSSEALLGLEVNEAPFKVKYDMKQLGGMVKAGAKIGGDTVQLCFAKALPLLVRFRPPNLNLDYYMAPYIE